MIWKGFQPISLPIVLRTQTRGGHLRVAAFLFSDRVVAGRAGSAALAGSPFATHADFASRKQHEGM